MVHVRIAQHEENIYLDLADADWWDAAIGPDSWRMVAEPPVPCPRGLAMAREDHPNDRKAARAFRWPRPRRAFLV